MTIPPDTAFVHALAAHVINAAIEEIRDTGAMDVSEICEDELTGLTRDEQDKAIRAVLDMLRVAEVTYRLPGPDGARA